MIIKNPIYVNKVAQAKTVGLLFVGDNGQTVLPDEGKVLSSVYIQKPLSLVPSNIKEGIVIAGVFGTLRVGTYVDDTTATPADVLAPKEFYQADGQKVQGTIQTYDGATSITQNGSVAVGGKYVPSNLTVNVPSNYAALANKTITAITADNLAGATQIGAYTFYGCSALESVVIPSTVTSIGASAFEGCTGVLTYDFTASAAVPTLDNVSAFTGINANCKIIVPDALYDTWIVAQNWATYAPYIVKYSESYNYIENGTLYANVGTATLTQGTLEVD